MRVYPFASRLPLHARAAACAETYVQDKYGALRTLTGHCPAGVALAAAGKRTFPSPGPDAIAMALEPRSIPLRGDIRNEAEDFITDWDLGKIPAAQLAVAFGLEDPR